MTTVWLYVIRYAHFIGDLMKVGINYIMQGINHQLGLINEAGSRTDTGDKALDKKFDYAFAFINYAKHMEEKGFDPMLCFDDAARDAYKKILKCDCLMELSDKEGLTDRRYRKLLKKNAAEIEDAISLIESLSGTLEKSFDNFKEKAVYDKYLDGIRSEKKNTEEYLPEFLKNEDVVKMLTNAIKIRELEYSYNDEVRSYSAGMELVGVDVIATRKGDKTLTEAEQKEIAKIAKKCGAEMITNFETGEISFTKAGEILANVSANIKPADAYSNDLNFASSSIGPKKS